MPTCTPQRVDHLDFNKSPLHQSIGRLMRDEDSELVYIIYCSRQENATNKTALYCRSFDPSTLTLGSVNVITEDNTGAGRFTQSPSPLKENYWPHACRLDNGRMIVAYQGNTAATRGMFIRESSDNGVTWSAEYELFHVGNPTAKDFGTIRALSTDGTNVFLLTNWTNGNGANDLLIRKRDALEDWGGFIKIWDNPGAADNMGWEFGAKFNQKNRTPTKAMSIKANDDTTTFSIAITAQLTDIRVPTKNLSIKCLECQDYEPDLGTGTWTERQIHDFGDDNKTRQVILDEGEDGALRVCYWGKEDVYGVETNWNVLGSAISEDRGVTWADVGFAGTPNEKIFAGKQNWNPAYDTSFGTDYENEWHTSTLLNSGTTTDYYYRFKNKSDSADAWTISGACDIEEFDTIFKTVATTAPPGDVIFVGTYMVRIGGSVISDPDSSTLALVLFTIGDQPDKPTPEEPEFPVTHRIWRRGLIQYVRTEVPQKNNITAAPIDRLDKPGSF